MRSSFFVLALLGALGLPGAAGADSGFRCPTGRLVSVGDRMGEVLDRCGEPDAVIQRTEKRKLKHKISRWVGNVEESFIEEQEVDVPIDEWAYDMGRYAFTRYVVFENGQVINVATGHYGNK
jgi:hypothetical protein